MKTLLALLSELAVDNRAIDHYKRAILAGLDVGVITRRPRIIKHDDIVRRAPDRAGGLRRQRVLPLASARICNL